MKKDFIIGIAGGSGSGKSSLAKGLASKIDGHADVKSIDNYFIAKEKMAVLAGEANYDDPRSIRLTEFLNDLIALEREPTTPQVLILEGFLILHFPEIRKLLDFSIFLDGDFDTVTARRVHPMWDNYRNYVLKPMYEKYVKPSSRYADIKIDVTKNGEDQVLDQVWLALLNTGHPFNHQS